MSRVAIIDSGINKEDAVCKLNIVKSLSININENNEITETCGSKCSNHHGTVIADIISQINPNVEIIDINILNDELQTNGHILLRAINRAIDLKPDIINISLGTNSIKYIAQMMKLIKSAVKNNIYIVAAHDNRDKITFPAALRDVIGVKRISTLCKSNDNLIYAYEKNIYYAPDSNFYIHKLHNCKCKYIMWGNSMSAAYITGELSVVIDKLSKKTMV